MADYTASPLGSFPELANMYQSSFSGPVSNARAGVEYSQDQTAVSNAKKAQAEAEARANAFADAKNYTVQQREDGGFGFYGPDGKELSAAQYANNTGQKLTNVLKDSQNPIDIRYVQDQQNLSKYLQAKAQSGYDKGQRAIAQQIEGDVQKSFGIKLGQQNPQQLIQLMQQNYPTIYGANQNNQPGFSGSSTALPGYGTAVGQLGGQSKVNKFNSSRGGSHNINSANPTGY